MPGLTFEPLARNKLIDTDAIKQAVAVLERGGVVAHPTEAVFGLGCDPLREDAVDRLLQLKGRPRQQGLIVIASGFEQLRGLLDTSDEEAVNRALATWPGPVTWVFPARDHVPEWLTGGRRSLAVRVTEHPVANALCAAFGRPVVSTSANRSGEEALREADDVRRVFGEGVDYVIEGAVGGRERPSEIRDARTGEILRAG